MPRLRLGVFLFLSLLWHCVTEASETSPRSANFAHSGGVYAVGSAGGMFGELNTIRADVDTDINEGLRAARDQGLRNVVQLNFGHRWNEDRELGMKKIQAWLERTDLSLVDVVHLAEEQPYNAASWLDPLYEVMKAYDPSLQVYVWPTFPMGPIGKADGYVYDAYGEGYMASRERFQGFLRTGKPLIVCVDVSGFSDFRLAREQVMACHELDIPIFYFAADSGKGSFNNWYGNPTAALSACRNFMFTATAFQRRCRGADPLNAADLVWGEQIALAPNTGGDVNLDWLDFGPASVFGFTRLAIDNHAVRVVQGEAVTLDYQFWSLLPVDGAQLHLDVSRESESSAPVQVAYARCGKLDDWRTIEMTGTGKEGLYDVGDVGQEFRIRVTLPKGVVLRGGHFSGKSIPPVDPAINLDTHFDGWRDTILFRQDLDVGLWRVMASVDKPEALNEGPALALQGKDGAGIGVSAVQKFISAFPLEAIAVRLNGRSHAALGGAFTLGVSLDGETILREGVATTEPRADGLFQGTHALDLRGDDDFRGVRSFYIHMTQRNGSGIRGNTSSHLTALEIDATRGQ